jgi:hypothetical protein
MRVSPEIVQTPPPSRSLAPASARADRPAGSIGRPKPETRPSNGISKVAWVPQGELEQSEWLATGRRLGAIGRCSQWWIGDWIRYGTAKWGEKYVEAARVTGYDAASLRNMAWVASQFDVSLRSDNLTWSHHVLLAPLEPVERAGWLDRASRERLSVADLRTELRAARGLQRGAGDAEGPSSDASSAAVCPHCGHELPPQAA